MARREPFQPKARQSSWKQVQRKPFDNSRAIRFKCSLQNTIIDVLRGKGWQEVKEGENDWDIFWCDVGWMRENFDHFYLQEHVKLCHFRNHYELTRKNLMVKNLKRLRKQIEREHGKTAATKCDFYPTSYELPAEYHIFVEEFKKNPGSVWIMKPVAKSQGKGIFLFKKLKDITDWRKEDYYRVSTDEKKDEKEPPETYIVQRYIENPYLIGGRKFDIRVYVLVTCYMPLIVWLYRDGFARFSNTRFSLDSIDDTYIHLTNVAIQKTAPDYDPEKGCKWSPLRLRKYLTAKHGLKEVDNLFRLIDEIIITSLQAVQKIIINDKHCFELYGYDILLDENLKPIGTPDSGWRYFRLNNLFSIVDNIEQCGQQNIVQSCLQQPSTTRNSYAWICEPNYCAIWLLEINASPSLTASSPADYDLKVGLLLDVLNIVDMENRLTGKEKRVGNFDLVWHDGPVAADDITEADCVPSPVYPTNSFLGCFNDREKQLAQLYQDKPEIPKNSVS